MSEHNTTGPEPVPIYGRGKIIGYMCGQCDRAATVCCGPAGSDADLAAKHDYAAQCCRCRRCGAVHQWGGWCQACRDATAAAHEAEIARVKAAATIRHEANRAIVNGPCPDAETRLRAVHRAWEDPDEPSLSLEDFAACLAGAEALKREQQTCGNCRHVDTGGLDDGWGWCAAPYVTDETFPFRGALMPRDERCKGWSDVAVRRCGTSNVCEHPDR